VRARGRATHVHARPRERDFYRADAVFTASAGKRGCARMSGRRPRTSGRKGHPDGHFHPKTSFMTSLVSGANFSSVASIQVFCIKMQTFLSICHI
jgi:hypothetical protein